MAVQMQVQILGGVLIVVGSGAVCMGWRWPSKAEQVRIEDVLPNGHVLFCCSTVFLPAARMFLADRGSWL